MNYQKLNNITGWAVFAIATLVYILTIEPTASFWDCGEFIATAYKLEVGHPPGAPVFMLIGRFFSMFAGPESAAKMVNLMSGICSSFTILFLFWSITALAKKIAIKTGEITQSKTIAILGSGAIGALAYTFSDSFWFSAVEGEVYAMSSFFTAIVFWAILKWESVADQKHSTRWIILIAYLMGLSIGVHLLNLLAIPAITFVYYFKKHKPSLQGIIVASIVSIGILGVMQAIIIPGFVNLAASFEKTAVNSMGMPFNMGAIIYILIITALLAFGLFFTHKRGMKIVNTIMLCVTVIIIGYSSFAMILIRSSANTPMDENNPENLFTLLSYLNREQYGDRPLVSGPYWNSPLDPQKPRTDGSPVYMKAYTVVKTLNGTDRQVKAFRTEREAKNYIAANPKDQLTMKPQYIVSDERKGAEYNYDKKFTTIFPRMYSPQANHVREYKKWSDYVGKPVPGTDNQTGQQKMINKPTFGENIKFFFRYQMGWMYWRYFLWNFAGRQNDIQGHGSTVKGNWLSGVKFVDAQRLGNQDQLPTSMTENKGYNRFFFLPLILGLIGLVFQLLKSVRDWTVVMLLFFFTGIAIVLYLNQYPLQPRERDYAYVGSFYAFAIWIGLGVYALYDAAKNLNWNGWIRVVVGTLGLAIFIYLAELVFRTDSHSFSYALGFMSVITMLILALMVLLGDKNKDLNAGVAVLLGLSVPFIMGFQGWDDHDRSDRYTARDFARNYLESCAPNAILFTNGDNDTFPLWYAQEVEEIRTDVRVVNLSLLSTDWYVNQMKTRAYESAPVPFKLEEVKYRQGTRDAVALLPSENVNGVYVDVDAAMGFVANDKNMRNLFSRIKKDAYFPTNRFKVQVDKKKVLENGTVAPNLADQIVNEVQWEINKGYLLKSELMLIDLLANNDWNRPIYFAVTTGPDSYIGLTQHFQLEGLAYRLVPIRTPQGANPNLLGRVNTDTMYNNLMNRFAWGGMENNDIYMDENNLRMTNNMRLQFSNLADALITEGKNEKAKEVLDRCMQVMPEKNIPYGRIMLSISDGYYKIGDFESANKISRRLFDIYEENLNYYISLKPRFSSKLVDDAQMAFMVLQRLSQVTNDVYKQEAIGVEFKQRLDAIQPVYGQMRQQIDMLNNSNAIIR